LSDRPVFTQSHGSGFLVVLGILLTIVVTVVLLTLGQVAFQRIGFSPIEYILILLSTLIGSNVNIPVARVASTQPLVELEEVRVFGLTYRIPRIMRQTYTIIAVNLGGAVTPVLVSIYLLATHTSLIISALVATLATSVLIHLVARRVRGVGIVTPALLPPIAAAIVAYLLAPGSPAIVAYVSGTLGALIGADLSNLRGIGDLGAPVASIGGAGTQDGVFLTGLVAALLVPMS